MKWFQFCVLLLFLLSGCSNGKIEKVDVYEMKSFSEIEENSLITFTDNKVVDIFINSFKEAKKEPGVVDMTEPEYQVELGEDKYFLWISEDHGTIMNSKDTHTISTLSKHSAKSIYKLLK